MADSQASKKVAGLNTAHLRLDPQQIEKVFNDCVYDLGRILFLEGIDMLPSGFRIRSHDLHGPLPESLFRNSGNFFRDTDRPGNDAKLIAIVRFRDHMIRFMPGANFLRPIQMDGKPIVGRQARPKNGTSDPVKA